MQKRIYELDGRTVTIYSAPAPRILFLQPVDEHDAELLDREVDAMRDGAPPFALAAFQVKDWNRDLSPWAAPPVFGKTPFGGGAEETLRFVTERLLPALRDRLALNEGAELCIGGYSLAGLFALWAATRTESFTGVAAASPSVWFPGWIDYVKATRSGRQACISAWGTGRSGRKTPSWPRWANGSGSSTRSLRRSMPSRWNGIRAIIFKTASSGPRGPFCGWPSGRSGFPRPAERKYGGPPRRRGKLSV